MKHSITILLICFSYFVHAQNTSSLLEGEWFVAPESFYNTSDYTQVWDFQPDGILILRRGNNTQEKYFYEVNLDFLVISDSIENLRKTGGEATTFWLTRYSDTYLIGEYWKFPDVDYSEMDKMIFFKKDQININPEARVSENVFYGMGYQVTSNLDSSPWNNAFITNFFMSKVHFIKGNCYQSNSLSIINTTHFSIISIRNVGSVQVIENIDSTTFKGISLENKLDTLTFRLVERLTNKKRSMFMNLELKTIKESKLSDFLDGKRILSIGMPSFSLQEDETGMMYESGNQYALSWHHLFENIYILSNATILDENNIVIRTKTSIEDKRVVAVLLDCQEEKTYLVEK